MINQKNNEIIDRFLTDGKSKVEVLFSKDDLWMTQGALAESYQTSS